MSAMGKEADIDACPPDVGFTPKSGHRLGALFGSRAMPMMNLSVEDVRSYIAQQLERINNNRLKLGNITADGDTISADIVTPDNSLVQRLKVNRLNGAIEYAG